jgi:hypothetical protein
MLRALGALAWFGGDPVESLLLLAVVAAGHLHSWRRWSRSPFLGYLLMVAALGVAVALGRSSIGEFLSTGSALPVVQSFPFIPAAASFGLRTRRNLYDAHALSLVVLLLVGMQAFTFLYLWFLLAFALVTAALLWASHLPRADDGVQRVAFPAMPASAAMGGVGLVAVIAVAVVAYLFLPQNHQVAPAGPLPSRLDLTGGWPPAPAGQSEGDWAPWAQFLPSRDEFGVTLGQGAATEADLAVYADLGYTSDQGDNVVMYVRSPLASFWRGYTLDVYDGRGWIASSATVQFQVDRQGCLRFADAPQRFPYRDSYAQTYFLRVAQPNALFTGYGAGWVSLGTGEAARVLRDPRGYVQYLEEASTYRIFSPKPRLTPASLREDAADSSDERYLALPPVPDRVRDLALRIVEGAPSDFDKAARLERFLLTQYPYDLRVSPIPATRTPWTSSSSRPRRGTAPSSPRPWRSWPASWVSPRGSPSGTSRGGPIV